MERCRTIKSGQTDHVDLQKEQSTAPGQALSGNEAGPFLGYDNCVQTWLLCDVSEPGIHVVAWLEFAQDPIATACVRMYDL